jgi:hypothetical protein
VGERVRLRVSLLHDLEASLGRGSRALVALDLAGMERETREQVGILRRLAASPAADCAGFAPALPVDLAQSGNAVRQALGLQAALLRRAQHKLRVIANMLADPAVNYPAPRPARLARAVPRTAADRVEHTAKSCRV